MDDRIRRKVARLLGIRAIQVQLSHEGIVGPGVGTLIFVLHREVNRFGVPYHVYNAGCQWQFGSDIGDYILAGASQVGRLAEIVTVGTKPDNEAVSKAAIDLRKGRVCVREVA